MRGNEFSKEGDELVALIEQDAKQEKALAPCAAILGVGGLTAATGLVYGIAHEDITETPLGTAVTIVGASLGLAAVVGSLDFMRGARSAVRQDKANKKAAEVMRASEKPNTEAFKHLTNKARAANNAAQILSRNQTVTCQKRPGEQAVIKRRSRNK